MKFAPAQCNYEGPKPVGPAPTIPAAVSVFTITGIGEPATVRGTLVQGDAGTTITLAHEYADLEPVGGLIVGGGFTGNVTARNGQTLEVA